MSLIRQFELYILYSMSLIRQFKVNVLYSMSLIRKFKLIYCTVCILYVRAIDKFELKRNRLDGKVTKVR